MSDLQSNVKPLTLTTGRVIFAIAGVYVTQSLVSALSMQSLPALVRAAGGSLALAGATTLFMLPWALKFIWAPWIERWRLPPDSPERRSRLLILRGQVAFAALLMMAAAIGWFGREGGFPIRKSWRYLFCSWWQARSPPLLILPATVFASIS
jgi:MFS transporter (putative signal transducer)